VAVVIAAIAAITVAVVVGRPHLSHGIFYTLHRSARPVMQKFGRLHYGGKVFLGSVFLALSACFTLPVLLTFSPALAAAC
jgi:hypothetical protein